MQRLARLSGGSPGQARELADPALWEFRRNFLRKLIEPQIDSVGLARTWTDFVEDAGKDSAAHRQRATLVLRLLIDVFSDVLHLQLCGRPRQSGEPEEMDILHALAHRVEPGNLLTILERCLQGDQQIDRRAQLSLVLEALTDELGASLTKR